MIVKDNSPFRSSKRVFDDEEDERYLDIFNQILDACMIHHKKAYMGAR